MVEMAEVKDEMLQHKADTSENIQHFPPLMDTSKAHRDFIVGSKWGEVQVCCIQMMILGIYLVR